MLSQLYRQRLRSCENKSSSVISAPVGRRDTAPGSGNDERGLGGGGISRNEGKTEAKVSEGANTKQLRVISNAGSEEPTCYHSQVLLAAAAVLLLIFVCRRGLICGNGDKKGTDSLMGPWGGGGGGVATISAIAGCGFIPGTYIICYASPLSSGIKRDYINVIIKLLSFTFCFACPPLLTPPPFEMPTTSRDHRFDAT